MKLDDTAIKVLIHDCQGGVSSSAAFLVLYNLLQQVDSSFTDTGQLKSSIRKIDVFGMVNRLRNDRAGMVSSYETYKLLHRCLEYYGPNRVALKNLVPMRLSSKSTVQETNSTSRVTRERHDEICANDSDNTDSDHEIPYSIEEYEDNDDQDHFEVYYEEYFLTTPEYQNIKDMSEYLK